MKSKQFHKGILQLVQEGAIQYYKTLHTEEVILGAVGQLQFEVFEHRMKNEYNVEVKMEPIGSKIARWIENEEDVKESMSSGRSMLVKDRFDNLVFLFENEFAMRWFADKTKTLNCIVFYNENTNRHVAIRVFTRKMRALCRIYTVLGNIRFSIIMYGRFPFRLGIYSYRFAFAQSKASWGV